MGKFKPKLQITNEIINRTVSIAELVECLVSTQGLSANQTLRRQNRIRTIHGSLAIEQNSLTLEQVTTVLNGKHVLAPPKDIAEVKNAFEVYEHLDLLEPCSVDSLLSAHGVMMRGLIAEAGEFRSGGVGVVSSTGELLHIGMLPRYAPEAVEDLLEWVRDSDLHPLIKGCVFHYQFEVIHPFQDGNGRTGRLWHTLLLSRWKPIFAWLPVESVIHDRQDRYYAAINCSNEEDDATSFVEFMLDAIEESLREAIGMSDKMSDKANREAVILEYLGSHETISNGIVQKLCSVSASTANRILRKMAETGTIKRVAANRGTKYSKS